MDLEMPSNWSVKVLESKECPVLTDDQLRERFEKSIGTLPIRELAKGKKKVCILTDDLSRPTPSYKVLPYILEELKEGGIDEGNILIIMAYGCHRHMTRSEMEKKLGAGIMGRIEAICHDALNDLEFLGKLSRGTPLYVNKYAMECDLKIGLGGIYPHGGSAWGGGAKIVLAGIAGRDSCGHNHMNLKAGGLAGDLENEWRMDMEEAAGRVGLDAIANVVLNKRKEIIGLFVGDFIKAHREGVKFASRACAVPLPEDADIVIANTYPMDYQLIFVAKGSWPIHYAKEGGTRILIGGCPDGVGYHSLLRPGVATTKVGKHIDEAEFILYSPIIGPAEAFRVYPECAFYSSWHKLLDDLYERYGNSEVDVAVYPYAAIQIPDKVEKKVMTFRKELQERQHEI